MDLKHNLPIKVISIIVLFFFCWSFGGIFDVVAFAATDSKQTGKSSQQSASSDQQSSASADQPMAGKPEEKFQKTLEDIEQILIDTSTDTDTKKNKLKTKKSEIESLDVEIKKQFADTEKKLKDEGLPNEILERHYNFVKKYEDNLNELKNNLDTIDKAKDKKETDDAIEKTKQFLEKAKPPKKHVPLDPNKLPHRTAEPVWIEPRTSPEEFQKDSSQYTVASSQGKTNKQKQILVASNGSLKGLISNQPSAVSYEQPTDSPMLLAAADPPTDTDLAETIEVQFTPAIQAKAQELGNNPVKIYNWVRNNIEFVPTYGSIQGADYCLQTKQCNAFDTSSLLIALLRASGIHSRYVYGTIELPIEKVKNWVGGFTDTNSAMTLIASGGIPVKGLTSGGKIEMVRMEHAWVEAYVSYGPYSGRPSKLDAPKTWIPLEPSFKQYTYTEGIDLQAAVPFDAQSFIDQIKSTATINEAEGYVTSADSNYIQTTLTNYQAQLQEYINQNIPNATAGDILGKKEIIKQELGILPATLPYKKIATGAIYSAIPDNLRHKVTFTITDPYLFETSLSYTASIPELAGKRITLSYTPASSTDQQTIDSYGGIYNVPAYLVNMKPQIKVEGVVKATGSNITLGNQQTFNMTFSGPNINTDVVSNNITAGAYYGIGLNPNKVPKELIEQRKAKLEGAKDNICSINIDADECTGELLYITAMVYFFELEAFEEVYAQSLKVADIKHISETLVTREVKVTYFLGIPTKINSSGLIIDVDRYIHSPISKVGDKTVPPQFMLISGQISSGMEHGIFEQLYNIDSISAVKAIKIANAQGIPIYTINQDNLSQILSKLTVSNEVKTDIIMQ